MTDAESALRLRNIYIPAVIETDEWWGNKARKDTQIQDISSLSFFVLPAQYGHGLAIIFAAQQLVDVGVQHGERQLKDDLDAVVEEAVHHHHRALERHDGQEEGEEPRERDGGDDPEVLHAVVQLRNVLAGQLLEHPLID